MRLEITVGQSPPHGVVFTWDQMWGGVVVTVDGTVALKTRQNFSFSLTTDWTLQGGGDEPHTITFRKTRPLLLSGFRPQTVTAYVDGIQVAETSGGLERRHVPQLIVIGVISAIVGLGVAAGVIFGLTALFSNL